MPLEELIRQQAAALQAWESGCYGPADIRTAVGAGQEVLRRLKELEEKARLAKERLLNRLYALGDGSREADLLIETIRDALERYIFLSAYAAINRDAPDWPELACELLFEEGVWPECSDPDVLAVFEAEKEVERFYRAVREHGGTAFEEDAKAFG